MKSSLKVVCVTALLASFVACSASTVISTLNDVVAAGEAAVVVLEATGTLPAGDTALISTYLQAVGTAATQSAVELATGDSAATKSVLITGYFATAVLPDIPGLPPQVAGLLKAVEVAVQTFLAQVHPTGGVSAKALSSKPFLLGSSEHKSLAAIQLKAMDLNLRAKALVK